MDNFVVSARKYRPTTFDTVVGQSHITTTLKNAIKNKHLAQSFLFCGPRGVGKTTNARILAKTINCENLTEDIEACDKCDSCRSFNESSSFNIHELDAASNNSVDDIRNLVEQVRYPPQGNGKYKIYIIDEVHMLSNAAFNAFLKTLEEPPKYAIFILATTEKHKIIPTILSRCQIFDFNRIQIKDIADHLAKIASKEKIAAEPQALHLIAQKADGALRDALSIFDLIVTFSSNNTVTYKTTIDNLHILDYDYYFKVTDYLYQQNISQTLLTYDKIIREGFDGHNFIVGFCEHLRNLMVCKDPVTLKLLEVSEDVKKKYEEQAAKISISFLMSALSIANNCDIHFKSSKNHRLHVELTLMKIGYLNAALDLTKIKTSPEEVKKKSDTVTKSVSDNAEKETSIQQENKADEIPSEIEAVVELKKETSKATNVKLEKSTINLSSLKNLKDLVNNKEPETKEPVIEELASEIAQSSNVDEDKLREFWKVYSLKFKTEGKTTHYIIMERNIQVDNHLITLELDNLIQVDIFNEFKAELLEFLRRKLSCASISIHPVVNEKASEKKMYTAKEKFNYLVEKNPALLELKNRLGLDTDF